MVLAHVSVVVDGVLGCDSISPLDAKFEKTEHKLLILFLPVSMLLANDLFEQDIGSTLDITESYLFYLLNKKEREREKNEATKKEKEEKEKEGGKRRTVGLLYHVSDSFFP